MCKCSRLKNRSLFARRLEILVHVVEEQKVVARRKASVPHFASQMLSYACILLAAQSWAENGRQALNRQIH